MQSSKGVKAERHETTGSGQKVNHPGDGEVEREREPRSSMVSWNHITEVLNDIGTAYKETYV